MQSATANLSIVLTNCLHNSLSTEKTIDSGRSGFDFKGTLKLKLKGMNTRPLCLQADFLLQREVWKTSLLWS